MSGANGKRPPLGTGGAGDGRETVHQNIIGDSIARNGEGADPEDLLPNPEPEEAVTFLEHFRPGGPWVLTAIEVDPPNGQKPRVPTTTLTTHDEVRRWVLEFSGGGWNQYFTVNRTFMPMSKKAKKIDIAAAVALHVDVDPRAGEDLELERKRALKVLREYEPAPSVIIDSGGGFQGFWLLNAPVELVGDPDDDARHFPVEDRNRHIAIGLQADNCHNIDRIMRLPGSVNWPDAKKRKKGRVARLARVVDCDWQRRYALDAFPTAAAAKAGRYDHEPCIPF